MIGKGTQRLVRESNGLDYDIGNIVQVLDIFVGESLICVRDTDKGVTFDLTIASQKHYIQRAKEIAEEQTGVKIKSL